ncbi:hypothetical protein [Oceanirhabdus sp. W0125-5]|uniref:hypothetical protein n=1 Tax=Oceanirhabdus sp. W0125-5 TaxID=2999116 RepID=UPI0022F2DD66|nr:hypothetical protein [Oceanirhabdus sp. W0125-5]WBW95877.1 hypothetical protein OW730_19615 [Oceanirhabdus sp. W0125-5]
MNNRFNDSSPPVEMNNNIYNMVSLQPSIAVDEMRFRTIGGGATGLGPGYGLGGLGAQTSVLHGLAYPGGAYGLANPYFNIGEYPYPSGYPIPGMPSNISMPSGGLGVQGGYDFTEYDDNDDDDDDDDRDKYKYDYDYNDVRYILMKIQRYNPGIFKALMRTGMPYYEVRRIIRKIIRLTMMYMKDDD